MHTYLLNRSNTLVLLIAATCSLSLPVSANTTPPIDYKSILEGHAPHIKVIKKIVKCFNSNGNRGKAIRSILTGSTKAADALQKNCITKSDRKILQSAPVGANMNASTRNKVLGSTSPPDTYYKSMSWGLGPSAAIGLMNSHAGFTLDGGFIWNINGHGSTRLYGSAGKAESGLAQLNLGVDPIIVSLYRSPVQSGKSTSYVVTGSIEAVVGITGGAYISSMSNGEYQGFTVALGAGVGFNIASIYRVNSTVSRGRCPDVTIEAVNNTGGRVKVIDVDYHDYRKAKWRSKVTPNSRIDNGGTYRRTMNLSKVDGEDSQIRVEYRVKKPFGWSMKVHKAWSNKETCQEGKTYTVSLNSH